MQNDGLERIAITCGGVGWVRHPTCRGSQ
jgi:hypothetical protein